MKKTKLNTYLLDNKRIFITLLVCFNLSLACKHADKNGLEEKQKALAKLKQIETRLNDSLTLVTIQIDSLQRQIGRLDAKLALPENIKLVTTINVLPQKFDHYLALQGKVDPQNVSYATPRSGGGQVREVLVKKGQVVKKGQALLKLDDALVRRQLQQVLTQLAYAKDVYERRNNLWKQNIGSELDLLNAKNTMENSERQQSILQEQLAFANVTADVDGLVDDITVKVGELFTGNSMGGGIIKIVNATNLKVVVQIPENYVAGVHNGSSVKIVFPDLNNKTLDGNITAVGKAIDPSNRSFYAEIKLPPDENFRPNQIVQVKILDYQKSSALVIPFAALQVDDKGKFVFLAVQDGSKLIARKRDVVLGETYGDYAEIKTGLQAGESIVVDGSSALYDGQFITTVEN